MSLARVVVFVKIKVLPYHQPGPGVDPGFCKEGFEFVSAESMTILKSGTSETPFPMLSG